MATVRDILRHKGHAVWSISPCATVLEAAERMNEHQVGSLVVLADVGLVGLISERDILARVVAQRLDPSTTLVEDIMTIEVVTCEGRTTVDEARSVMKNRRIRHLPVLEADRQLIGMISIGDLNAQIADTQEHTIHLLQTYIYGQT